LGKAAGVPWSFVEELSEENTKEMLKAVGGMN
jgi:hypothetical protein